MAKDPAFLFYPGDWQGGTMTFSRFLKGCYIDILIAQFNNGHLSIDEIKTVLGSDFGQSWPTLQKKFVQDENGLWFNEKLEHETKRRREYTESRRQSRLKSDEDNVRIYLIKDNDSGYTKIGSSVNPQRRFAEMINQASPAIVPGTGRNYTLTWFSEPTQRKIEKSIHQHFKSQRVKGEWFNLTEDDIRTLIHTFFRTSLRTENENENENRKVLGGVGERGKQPSDFYTNGAEMFDDVKEDPSLVEQLTRVVWNEGYRAVKETHVMLGVKKFCILEEAKGTFRTKPREEFRWHLVNWTRKNAKTISEYAGNG